MKSVGAFRKTNNRAPDAQHYVMTRIIRATKLALASNARQTQAQLTACCDSFVKKS
jgi:hypothetical protein